MKPGTCTKDTEISPNSPIGSSWFEMRFATASLLAFALAVLPGCAVGLLPAAAVVGVVLGLGGGDDDDENKTIAPDLVTVTPVSGPSSGGTSITLTGTGFQSGAVVTVGGNACSGYDYAGIPVSIVCVTPAGTTGAKEVTVRNPDGRSDTLPGAFTYATAGPSAAIGLSPSSLSYFAVEGGADPASKTFDVSNTGDTGTTLNWTASKTQGWLSLTPVSGSVATGADTVTVSVSVSGLTPDTYVDTITVTDAGASNSPRTLSVTFSVSPAGGPTLTSIEISPVDPAIPLNAARQFTAQGTYSDLTTADITELVLWVSADESAVTISNDSGSEGLAMSVGSGSSAITATYASVTSNTSTASVSSVPVVWGFARYADSNKNGACDSGDTVVVPFNVDITLNSPSVSDFSLPVYDDSFGSGASIASGPGTNKLTITLGTSPRITTRQAFTPARTDPWSPSGIEISASMAANAIESGSGADAVPYRPMDVLPAFVDSGQALGASCSRECRLGDVDGDGDLDWVVANQNGGGNRVYLNDGGGTFTDSGQSLGSNNTYGVSLGDVDSDGDLDILAGNRGQADRVWLNDGSGTFTDSGQSLGSAGTWGVELADLDGDGDLDFSEATDSGQPARVYLNDGSGVFTDSGQTLGNTTSGVLLPLDTDGDGDLDLVDANNSAAKIWLNDGSGTFTDSGQSLQNAHRVCGADVDRDGDVDLVFGSGSTVSEMVTVWLNDGSGVFFDSGQVLGNGSTHHVNIADFDCDGDLDVFSGNVNPTKPNTIWLNDGSGRFKDSGCRLGSSNTQGGAVGDIDGDGDIDVIAANSIGSTAEANCVYFNSLSGTWGQAKFIDSGQSLGSSCSRECRLGDVDGDGDLDWVVANQNGGGNKIYLNDGGGTFTDSGQSLGTNNTYGVSLGDVDSDGDLDILAGNRGQADRVWLNDGSGSFTDSGQSLGSAGTWGVELADLDGDGDLDFSEASDSGQPARIYLNNGSGVFTDSGQTLGNTTSGVLLPLDTDGDGDLDLVDANNSAAKIWRNDGSGTFTDSGQSLQNAHRVCGADVDGDGDVDLVFGSGSTVSEMVTVWLNDGSGTFTDSGQSLGSGPTHHVSVFDFDGDGDADIYAGNVNPAQQNRIWRNDGSGTFSDSGFRLGAGNTQGGAVGDIDGDGDMDLVACNSIGSTAEPNCVHFNRNADDVRAVGWIGGGSDGWKTGSGAAASSDLCSFNRVDCVRVDSSGKIYAADRYNHRICKWSSDGTALGWIGGGSDGWHTSGTPSAGTDYRSFTAAPHFRFFLDGSGNLYVTDTGNHRICKWSSGGTAIGWIGGGSNGWKQTAAPASSGADYQSFDTPRGVWLDQAGCILVADGGNFRISKWDSGGNAIGWIGGGSNGWKQTSAPSSGSDYQSFNNPDDVCVEKDGFIYIGDSANHRVCKWTSDGTAIGWIGGGQDGWQQGTAPSSGSDYQSLNHPYSMFPTESGFLYVSDANNSRMSKWTTSGKAVGWFGGGNGWQKSSSAPGNATDYESFYWPLGIFMQPDGTIFVADNANNRVSKWKD